MGQAAVARLASLDYTEGVGRWARRRVGSRLRRLARRSSAADGFGEGTQRAVKENAKVLKFGSAESE